MTTIIRSGRPEAPPPESSEATLEAAQLFRELGPERLVRLRPVLRLRRFARQETLFREGTPAGELWTLQRGLVRLYKISPNGSITTLEMLGPGEIFGAVSALDEETYPASAEALAEGAAWCLPRAVFLRLLADEPRLGVEVLRIVSRRLRDAQERLRALAHDPAPARLVHELLRRARTSEARVTRRALAEAAGTTVETAIRVLRRLERRGFIQGEVGRIVIRDELALRRIAEGAEG
jgi:CRP/FNR family transcriptional regulator